MSHSEAALDLSHQAVARRAVARVRNTMAGSSALAEHCGVPPAFIDSALAPLVDAGKLLRINAFRKGAAEYDYRWSSTWIPQDADYALCDGGGTVPPASISAVAAATPGPLRAAAALIPAHVARPPVTTEERVEQGRNGASTKHARDALDRAFTQTPQSLGWAPAPVSEPEPEAQPAAATAPVASPTRKESPMSTTKRKSRPIKATSAQFQICAALMAKGDLTPEDLTASVTAEAPAIANAVRNAKSLGRIAFIKGIGKFRITVAGKEWASGGANLDNQKAHSSPREVKRGRRQAREKSASLPRGEKNRLGVVDVRANGSVKKPSSSAIALGTPAPIQLVQERSFRCAVYSDGGFFLAKGDQKIELTAAEHSEMLRYQERMCEQQV